MKRLEITVDGKRYIWAPKAKNIVFILATLVVLVYCTMNVGTVLVNASTRSLVDNNVIDTTKDFVVTDFVKIGNTDVYSVNLPQYNGSSAVTEYGTFPILATNTKLVPSGTIVYLELGNTNDDEKSMIYWCVDGSKYLPDNSVALVNNNLTREHYENVSLYHVVTE